MKTILDMDEITGTVAMLTLLGLAQRWQRRDPLVFLTRLLRVKSALHALP
jgi:hypothetical protein